jgi:hypothetical protein
VDDLVGRVRQILSAATLQQRAEIFRALRQEIRIHPLEADWNTSAEAILEAINRASDLTKRGIRGILAEASFFTSVLPPLLAAGWRDVTTVGNVQYDAAIQDDTGVERVQIKLQRRKDGRPMRGTDAPKVAGFAADVYVVETQKTRAGERGGKATRPYHFGEFEILAVSLAPSTDDWTAFLFTVADWLIPDPADSQVIYKYQPVPPQPNGEWTSSITECIAWRRSRVSRRVRTSC